MKSSLLSVIFSLLLASSFASYLRISDPLNWQSTTANIDSAKITITPQLYYAQVDLELVYSAQGTSFYTDASEPNLEVLTYFEVPENTIVIDSWLWIEDYISPGHLIDIYTATNIYESYVVRAQDPSLLKYRSYANDELQLNIYPLPANSYRKVKLSFLVPIEDQSSFYSLNPIVDLFANDNANVNSYCEVIVNNSSVFTNGGLQTSPINFSTLNSSATTSTFLMDLNAIDTDFRITYQNTSSQNHFSYYSSATKNFYYTEKFIPVSANTCSFGTLDKVMDNSSIILDEELSTTLNANGLLLKEIGTYYNNPPERIILNYICDSVLYKDTIGNLSIWDPSIEKIWAKEQINQLYNSYSDNNYYGYYNFSSTEADEIIALSMETRVLSPFTAFLALPMDDTIQASNQSFTSGNSDILAIHDSELDNIKVNAYPNPMQEEIKFTFDLTGNVADFQIKIIDLSGKVLKVFDPSTLNVTSNTLTWDGKDDKGIHVAPGIYFALINFGNQTKTIEILKQ